jgi:hypothetical protein
MKMSFVERLYSLNPELCQENPKLYEQFRIAHTWVQTGMGSIIVGSAVSLADYKTGAVIAGAGAAVDFIGVAAESMISTMLNDAAARDRKS